MPASPDETIRPVTSKKVYWKLLLISYCIYAAYFIFVFSFVVNSERYFTLFEDGMISMRYAKHLAEGKGLVWNAGEAPVEGFTNFLWVLYMAIFHMLPIPSSKISLLINVTGAVLLFGNVVYVRRIAEALSGNFAVGLCAAFLTAFYFPLNYWGLQGMEVSLLALIVTLCVYKTIKANHVPLSMYVVLALSTLVRMEMTVIYVMFVFCDAFVLAGKNYGRLRSSMLVPLVAVVAAHTIFRWLYFGDILPNTYYLKMTGYPVALRISRGLYVMLIFLAKIWLVVTIAFLCLKFVPNRKIVLLVILFTAQCAYSVYVGGDAWEDLGGSNRFVSIVMPLLFILFAQGSFHLKARHRFFSQSFATSRLIILTFAATLMLNALDGPKSLLAWSLIKPRTGSNQGYLELALACKEVTRPSARVAAALTGVFGYFVDRNVIDLLGKNDRVIAHQQMHLPSGEHRLIAFYPGHMKWDYDYAIGGMRPDAVTTLWTGAEAARPYLTANYETIQANGIPMYVRKNSAHVRWDKALVPENARKTAQTVE